MSDDVMVPVRVPIPEGWEAVEVRLCKVGDQRLGLNWNVITCHWNADLISLILRPKFVWPDWLTCHWIVKTRSGGILGGWKEPPDKQENLPEGWLFHAGNNPKYLSDFVDIDIPGPWRDSLRLNPRKETDGTID